MILNLIYLHHLTEDMTFVKEKIQHFVYFFMLLTRCCKNIAKMV